MTTKKEAFAVPTIYLSPSTQEYNPYVTGGDEEYYMNLLADELEPWLRSSGIRWTRNDPGMTAADAIRQSNQGNYDLHLALHSNASPPGQAGQNRGSVVYYDPRSSRGRRAAQIIARNLRDIYPGRVQTLTTTELGEVNKTTAPAVLVEVAYHDNPEDAMWITANLPAIAENLALSVTGVAGPDSDERGNPVGLVYLALAWEGGEHVREIHAAGPRPRIRTVAASHGLDLLRRYLTGLEL